MDADHRRVGTCSGWLHELYWPVCAIPAALRKPKPGAFFRFLVFHPHPDFVGGTHAGKELTPRCHVPPMMVRILSLIPRCSQPLACRPALYMSPPVTITVA